MLSEELRRISLVLFKDKNPPGDTTQVPASGATYVAFRQGATLSAPTVVPSSSIVRAYVYDTGQIQQGDTVQWGQDLATLLYVYAIDPGRKWLDLQPTTYPVTLGAGDRLVPLYSPPILYQDSLRTVTFGSNVLTLDADGRASFFTPALVFDGVLTGAGPTRIFPDVVGGFLGPLVDVRSYSNFQAAHDDLPTTGGTLLVPAGTYSSNTQPAFTGLTLTKPVAIIGAGNGPSSALSIIIHDTPGSQDINAITINSLGGCVIKNLFIQWPVGTGAGGGRGLRWYKGGDIVKMAGLELHNVVVQRSPNLAFEFVCDGHEENYVSKVLMRDCTAFEAESGGSLLLGGAGTNNNTFERCEFNGPGFGMFYNVNSCSVPMDDSSTVKSAGGASNFAAVNVGDAISGMGIRVDTTVTSVDTTSSPNTLRLSKPAIYAPYGPTTLTFYRATPPGSNEMGRGHVHLMRTSISRFHNCTFQGPNSSAALSTDLVSNDLVLRDTYRETSVSSPTPRHSFLINGVTGVLIDGLEHYYHNSPSLVLETGGGGMNMGKIANAQLIVDQTSLTNMNVVSLKNATDELVIVNGIEQSTATFSIRRDIVVEGSGDVLPEIIVLGTESAFALPDGSSEFYRVKTGGGGSATISSIEGIRAGRRVCIVFEDGTELVSGVGGNLTLSGAFSGGAGRTITMVYDGTNWIELSRSVPAGS